MAVDRLQSSIGVAALQHWPPDHVQYGGVNHKVILVDISTPCYRCAVFNEWRERMMTTRSARAPWMHGISLRLLVDEAKRDKRDSEEEFLQRSKEEDALDFIARSAEDFRIELRGVGKEGQRKSYPILAQLRGGIQKISVRQEGDTAIIEISSMQTSAYGPENWVRPERPKTNTNLSKESKSEPKAE